MKAYDALNMGTGKKIQNLKNNGSTAIFPLRFSPIFEDSNLTTKSTTTTAYSVYKCCNSCNKAIKQFIELLSQYNRWIYILLKFKFEI